MKPSLVIAGLGNHGASYAKTRHNAGFAALDVLSEVFGQGEWKDNGKFDAQVQEARVVAAPVLLVKPSLYMNRSGEVLRRIVDFYKLDPATQLLVLVDEIDVALGKLRFREKGGPGTHNGLRSINEQFGEGYPRLRIGIGPKPATGDLAAWVLSVPPEEERVKLEEVLRQVPDRVRAYVMEGKMEE
jgi:peptidyl-tRNA hydrolase, PTH1 family